MRLLLSGVKPGLCHPSLHRCRRQRQRIENSVIPRQENIAAGVQVEIADYVAGYCRRLFGDRQSNGPERVAKKQPVPIEVPRNARCLKGPRPLDIFVEPDSKQIFLALLFASRSSSSAPRTCISASA